MRTRRRLSPLLAVLCLALPHGMSSQPATQQPASSTATVVRDTATRLDSAPRRTSTTPTREVGTPTGFERAFGVVLLVGAFLLAFGGELLDDRPADVSSQVRRWRRLARGTVTFVTVVGAATLGTFLLTGAPPTLLGGRAPAGAVSSPPNVLPAARITSDSVHAAVALPPIATLDGSGLGFVFAVAGVLVVGAAACFALFVDAARSDRPLVEGHWGGFGGGASGWRVSPAVLFLVGLLALGAMLTAFATAALRPAPNAAAAPAAAPPAKGE
ncbi:hypothetical protein J421_0478 [Gemmatirosa kalamazoonensis]|uniref:Uncharacterized protein n=1 Tax=Gemmatirosa kalamazoonensis TaxID=861299 RepID=W0RCG6_9BACT|nr:hypothetical protein [Gemmatirosa kalamazoonensis]AHG88015.1 hypothetical protein J421_0478 [Gemmatirosa kalamazoonensis]